MALQERCSAFVSFVLAVALVAGLPARGAAADTWQWYERDTNPAVLIHGVKETDAQDFFAGCTPRSGRILLILTQTAKYLTDGGEIPVVVAVDSRSRQYTARGSVNQDIGAAVPMIRIDTDDPLLDWMAAGYRLRITSTDTIAENISLAGSAPAVRHFVAVCRGA